MGLDSDDDVATTHSGIGIEMATPARRYNQWIDPETGATIDLKGGLVLPVGYEYHQEHPERPWVCPIRDCRILARSSRGLAYHFKVAHKQLCLNDNGDGTFSEVGTHEGRFPTVVSKNPLGPDAPPMAAARIPEGVNTDAENKRTRDKRAKAAQAPVPEAVPSPVSESLDLTTTASDPNGLWGHICAALGRDMPVPNDTYHNILLRQPLARALSVSGPLEPDLSERHTLALLIQITGVTRLWPCSLCRREGDPFHNCVSVAQTVGDHLRSKLHGQTYSCACCLLHRQGHICSMKRRLPGGLDATSQKFVRGTSKVDKDQTSKRSSARRHSSFARLGPSRNQEVLKDGNDEDDNDALQTRALRPRSVHARKRRRTAGGQFAPKNASADTSVGEASHPSKDAGGPASKRKMAAFRTLNIVQMSASGPKETPETSNQQAGSSKGRKKAVAPVAERAAPPMQTAREALGMENWEVNGGQVASGSAGASNYLASRMSAGQTVQLFNNVSLVATVITSGSTYIFGADATMARAGVLLAGKVKVDVDGETQFAVGPHGVFRIPPGVGCAVHNHCYVDAALQITSISVIDT